MWFWPPSRLVSKPDNLNFTNLSWFLCVIETLPPCQIGQLMAHLSQGYFQLWENLRAKIFLFATYRRNLKPLSFHNVSTNLQIGQSTTRVQIRVWSDQTKITKLWPLIQRSEASSDKRSDQTVHFTYWACHLRRCVCSPQNVFATNARLHCSDITNTWVGISSETELDGGNRPIYFVYSGAICPVVVLIRSWCVTPHSSPTRGCWPCWPLQPILNIFTINIYIH